MNRVVVTGMGVISSLGNDIDTFWNNIKNGKSGINFIKSFNVENYDTKFAAYVNDINYKNISKKDIIFDSRFMTFARLASREAYETSKLNINKIDKDSFGICISNSMGGVEKIVKGYDELKEKGASHISPMLLIGMLPNMASSKVAIDLGANGSNIPVVSSCAGGANAIGEGYIKIKNGYEKIMLVGASDASIQPLTIALFQAMKVMYRGDNIDEASIPFDKRRSGFVIGEGAGIIILEELEHAKERNAKIYAEVVGYGSNCDAYSLSSPDYEKLVLK